MNKNKLTSLCHQVAEKTGFTFNSVLTYFFLESVLQKLSKSKKSKNFIFKGGFLLANVVGLDSRSTVDIDFLVQKVPLTQETIIEILESALSKDNQDAVLYSIKDVSSIKEQDEYGGFRVSIECAFENIKQIVPLDISTGDVITPHPIDYTYNTAFFEENIQIKAYNLETMIAEKLHTIYTKGFFNSRSKDFYDLYIMYTLKRNEIDVPQLEKAIKRTFEHRETVYSKEKIQSLLTQVCSDTVFLKRWETYAKKNSYVGEGSFKTVIDSIQMLLSLL